ncbi:leucyl/phenylalanyl-tRNA--protein transferase [Hahella chejuensis KCTC 2396]|uniref:Leucyl/phenylalanyl-tRNA--protein transferase n=1 Tax=Hahella chejuensis (strain KCTC 2396) TaxID=349521 RepID=LFTR_HAHCH|nr:leucyl/phenylalanyl-tRNA--protein transferase [Hahella chejuensis]Q2SJK8.1 RecName: Full=Leucyl/phenylalanyl-tRNA--protein transferase; AltName: Full=L/F-transferase; AltName: Full=Leucyltransferase; AltName: Full=Phenyalanyltransferase [Hahella chejuensis KCTC 2396]ABC29166.1 leucyl/phenylalanyl-tRNA--protein transferase [Hahella chejuensis KCTC 2396]
MPALPWLDENLWFPHPDSALKDPNGLLCVGGDLHPARLRLAYENGIFPWFSEDQPILWWSPDPRCIIRHEDLHISRSMRRFLRNSGLTYSFDQHFTLVVQACAAPRSYSNETWITRDMLQAYSDLHQIGVAHSIEVWRESELVGGLYGLAIGRCFFGESMFSKETNASKAAFITLVRQLHAWGYRLIDCQVPNPHLLSLGACQISRKEFLSILEIEVRADFSHPWKMTIDPTGY